jgi:DNA integrity scanning protein DisA with diadenylate cyclase activity
MELKGIIGKAISDIAEKNGANCVLILNKLDFPAADTVRIKSTMFRTKVNESAREEIDKKNFDFLTTKLPPDSVSQIRKILIEIINKGGLLQGDRVFCVTDKSFGAGFEGLFLLFNIDEKFMELSTVGLEKEISRAVLDRVLDIAREISKDGSEGYKVGTAFIIGDHDKVLEMSSQLILNPFEGHPLKERNVLDPQVKETVKNYAQLDGCFVVDNNGFIHAAGRYLNVDSSIVYVPGFGARHTSCAAISKLTNAVAVVVSESGGKIRVFKDGNIVHEEKPV